MSGGGQGLTAVKPGTLSMAAPFGGGQIYSGGVMGALQNPAVQHAMLGASSQMMQRPQVQQAPNMLTTSRPAPVQSFGQTQAASPFQVTPLGAQVAQSLAPWMMNGGTAR